MRPLGEKTTQPLRTKKYDATSRQKNHATSWDKKSQNLFWGEKRNALGQKNHETSWVKK